MSCSRNCTCNKCITICGCSGKELNFKCLYYREGDEPLANLGLEDKDNGEEFLQKLDALLEDLNISVASVLPEAPTCPLPDVDSTSTLDTWILTYDCDEGAPAWVYGRITKIN